jgi:uncharacterized protein with PIN domain
MTDTEADIADGPFLLDAMLGTLAVYLRMCGYDAAYALDRDVEADDRVQAIATGEARTLLTRDEQLAARTPGALLLTTRDVEDQLRELEDAGVELALPDRPERCGTCNGPVERVPPDDPTPAYASDAGGTDVWRCLDCGQHFWRGSHRDRGPEAREAVTAARLGEPFLIRNGADESGGRAVAIGYYSVVDRCEYWTTRVDPGPQTALKRPQAVFIGP